MPAICQRFATAETAGGDGSAATERRQREGAVAATGRSDSKVYPRTPNSPRCARALGVLGFLARGACRPLDPGVEGERDATPDASHHGAIERGEIAPTRRTRQLWLWCTTAVDTKAFFHVRHSRAGSSRPSRYAVLRSLDRPRTVAILADTMPLFTKMVTGATSGSGWMPATRPRNRPE